MVIVTGGGDWRLVLIGGWWYDWCLARRYVWCCRLLRAMRGRDIFISPQEEPRESSSACLATPRSPRDDNQQLSGTTDHRVFVSLALTVSSRRAVPGGSDVARDAWRSSVARFVADSILTAATMAVARLGVRPPADGVSGAGAGVWRGRSAVTPSGGVWHGRLAMPASSW